MKAVIFTHVLYLILIKAFLVKGVTKCESKVELRAVMLSCPSKDSGCEDDDPLSQVMKSEESQILQADSKNFEALKEEKERGFPTEVRDCKRKLVITLKVKNVGKIPCNDEYIVVDHVFDPVTGGRGRLLSPVVVKLRQEQMIQLYGLQFRRVVNSDPFEEQKAGVKPCSVDPENPTCGIAMYDGKPIPFSEGFCCSCDPHANAKRQLPPVSRGDSFLYRDSKLISQGNPRPVREEKPRAIVNPELVMLKSGSSDKASADGGGGDCGVFDDPLCWDRIPNFLLENDRKIVCDRGDFLKELCRLREDKIEAESTSTLRYKEASSGVEPAAIKKGSRSVKSVGKKKVLAAEEGSTTGSVGGGLRSKERANDVLAFENFLEELKESGGGSSVPSSDGYNHMKGSRGKRENRRESKNLNLEEKLHRFETSRKHMKNRRKRLLELSHRRFRKAEERCKTEAESQKSTGLDCKFLKSSPPRYFFTHDRAIVDPLEPSGMIFNSSCKFSQKESAYANGSKGKPCGEADRSEMFRSFKEDKKEKLIDREFLARQPKNENKLGRKNKYFIEKLEGKKDKAYHAEDGRAGGQWDSKAGNLKESLRDIASQKSDRLFNPFERSEKIEDLTEGAGKKEGKASEDQKNSLNGKSSKFYLFKNEAEKRPAKSKIKNFFMSKGREKQKLRSEATRGHKKEEWNFRESLGSDKDKNHLSVDENQMWFDRKKLHGTQQERENLKAIGEIIIPERGAFSTETPVVDQRPSSKASGEGKEYSEALSRKPQGSSLDTAEEKGTNVDFDFEIIRNRLQEISRHRHYPISPELYLKFRGNSFPPELKGGARRLDSLKQISAVHHKPLQSFYLLERSREFPEKAFLLQGRPGHFAEVQSRLHSDKVSFDPTQLGREQAKHNAYAHKNSARRYHAGQAGEYERSEPRAGRAKQSFQPEGRAGRSDKTSEAPASRIIPVRYLESVRQPQEGSPKGERRLNLEEGGQEPQVEVIRSKRSVQYSFQPARGFYVTESDSQKPNENMIHELESCVAGGGPDRCGGDLPALRYSRSKHDNLSADSSFQVQEFLSRLSCPTAGLRETTRRERKPNSDRQRLIQSYLNAPDYVLEEVKSSLKGKRQATEQSKKEGSRAGAPGEKECSGAENRDTAHCMRFGDMWYSLYMIKQPVISQMMGVQLFDKHFLCDGTTQWRDLTKGRMIRTGTFLSKAQDDLPTISLTFMGEKTKKVESAIDPDNYFLLIPSHVSDPSKVNSYPQFEGGPAEYLVVESKDVSSGGECNMIGTSFEAFARQPDRCSQRRGSCLKRQPVDLWREDMEARIKGKKGKYFVENFGNVPLSPIKSYANLTGEFLALEYYGEYTSTIEIELKADSNAIIRKGSNAQIPLVYTDSTFPKKTRIMLSVLNIGLTSSYFRPRLGDCPPDLDSAWCPLEGPLVTIPPQQRHDFKLDLSGPLPSAQVFLTVQILNQVNKQIASRKIIMKRGDRCVCAFHCKCNCIGNMVNGRTCRKLSLKEYRKAGYIGSYPFRGGAASSASDSVLGNIHIIVLTAIYVLLFLGVLKGIVGIFIRRIGIAGTRIITGPRELCEYYECELLGCSVLYDKYGFPVHPTTCEPVQILPLGLEVITNFFFFFLYPLRGLCFLLKSLSCCKAFFSDFDGYCRHDEGDCDHKSSRPLLSKQPNPTCVHYNLTTFDSKKSKQEHLPYPAYNGDDDPLEEDDTEFVLQEMKRYRKK